MVSGSQMELLPQMPGVMGYNYESEKAGRTNANSSQGSGLWGARHRQPQTLKSQEKVGIYRIRKQNNPTPSTFANQNSKIHKGIKCQEDNKITHLGGGRVHPDKI